MLQNLKVSVCMITYNHEKFIEEAINSVLIQKCNFEVELIIANDNSLDETDIILDNILKKHPKASWINYTKHKKNIGMTSNFICALEQCTGKYIALCEGDDYWTDPLKLQKQVDFLEANQDYSNCFTRFKVKNENEGTFSEDKNGRYFNDNANISFDFEKFVKGWYGGIPTLVFRRSSFSTEICKKYKYFRDVHLITELLIKGKGVCINSFTTLYRIHDGGIHSSATILERAHIGSLCYRELYLKNKNIRPLRRKYDTFQKDYIKQLIKHKKHYRAILQTLLFGFDTTDWGGVKKESLNIFKKTKLGKVIKQIFFRTEKKIVFSDSKTYWDERYKRNETSGAGSYGRLANFKAEVLNEFVAKQQIKNVIEFGMGDGNQLSLAVYPDYIGFDVSKTAIQLCKKRFQDDTSKQFYNMEAFVKKDVHAELTLSLDVLYHLIEDQVFHNYMQRLFESAMKYVIIYSSNYNDHFAAHVKCRKFTDWIDVNVSKKWELKAFIKNIYPFDDKNPNHTSMADFYIYKKIKA